MTFVAGFVSVDLPVSTADVVGAYLASNVIRRFLFGEVFGFLADDDGGFSFVVEACLAKLWYRDWRGGIGDGVGWFEKHCRVFRVVELDLTHCRRRQKCQFSEHGSSKATDSL